MDKVTSPDKTVLAYDRLGAGPPLVLVSGASCDRRNDAPLAQGLAAHFTVLTYDRRGRGESTDTLPFSVDREIDDIEALLGEASDAAGLVILVGQSSGGALAARAVAAGLPARALVMWETPYPVDAAGVAGARAYTRSLKALLAEHDLDGALALFMRMVGMPEPMIAGAQQSPYWAAGLSLAPTLAYDDAAMGDGGVPVDLLADVSVPTLTLAGGASPEWMRVAARQAAEALPQGRYAVLPGQTHNAAPEVLADAVAQFAQSLS